MLSVGNATGQIDVNVRQMVMAKPLTNTLHVQCPEWTSTADVGCLITNREEQETQTLYSDKLLSQNEQNSLMPWTGVAATQTSPGDVRLSDVVSSAGDLLLCFADASTATSPEPRSHEGEGADDALLRPFNRGRSRPFPKLGDIEQFSTETQTDEFDLLKIATVSEENSVREVGVDKMVDEEDDPFTSFKRQLIEATTQFDLDDILCSNYTQTCPGSRHMLLLFFP